MPFSLVDLVGFSASRLDLYGLHCFPFEPGLDAFHWTCVDLTCAREASKKHRVRPFAVCSCVQPFPLRGLHPQEDFSHKRLFPTTEK